MCTPRCVESQAAAALASHLVLLPPVFRSVMTGTHGEQLMHDQHNQSVLLPRLLCIQVDIQHC
jgi:hypothetical protein